MPTYPRLIAQLHHIDADDNAQADQIARIRADAVNTALRPLGHATAWGVSVADGVSGADELMEILTDTYLFDEVDDDPERNPHPGYLSVTTDTMIPERLMAWRDAAVKTALDAMLPPRLDERIGEITRTLKMVSANYFDYGRLHDERAELMRVKREHADAVKRALESR